MEKLLYSKKCVICDKMEFVTKERKMYFTKYMSKVRLSHIYRGNNYVSYKKSYLKSKTKKKPYKIKKIPHTGDTNSLDRCG